MAWRQVVFALPAARAGLAEAALEAWGASAVTWAEAEGAEAVLEPPPGETRLWDRVRVEALFEADADLTAIHAAVAAALGEAPADWQAIEVPDTAWERVWLADFKPLHFGHGLWVVPTGTEPPDPGAVNLRLDPGLAFGTGTHPTTALCLEALAAAPPVGQTVIDYGCGSGLLGIAALKLGAARVIAVDNDPQALMATRDNAARNAVAERLVVQGVEAPLPDADVVVANILAGVLIELAPRLLGALQPGGRLQLAGLLDTQAAEVRGAYEPAAGFGPGAVRDGWRRLDGQRHGDYHR